jgi:hypothetical protein
MQAGHSVLVTGFTARLPARPGSTRRPSPATVAARGPSPPPGRPACLPGEGQARMTLPAATAPDAEGRTPARGTQL